MIFRQINWSDRLLPRANYIKFFHDFSAAISRPCKLTQVQFTSKLEQISDIYWFEFYWFLIFLKVKISNWVSGIKTLAKSKPQEELKKSFNSGSGLNEDMGAYVKTSQWNPIFHTMAVTWFLGVGAGGTAQLWVLYISWSLPSLSSLSLSLLLFLSFPLLSLSLILIIPSPPLMMVCTAVPKIKAWFLLLKYTVNSP